MSGGGLLAGLGSSVLDSALDSLFGNLGLGVQDKYNSRSQKRQFEYDRQLQWEQNMFNSFEAEKSRNWASAQALANFNRMLYASNTAHQREVKDLRAAGLNPILSATGGSGASTFNVATPTANQASGHAPSVSALGVSAPIVKSHLAQGVSNMLNAFANVEKIRSDIRLQDARVDNVNSATRLQDVRTQREEFASMYDNAFATFRAEKESIGVKQANANLEKTLYTLNKMAMEDEIDNSEFGRAMRIYDKMSSNSGGGDFLGITKIADYIGKKATGALSAKPGRLFKHKAKGVNRDAFEHRWKRPYMNYTSSGLNAGLDD